MELQKVLDMRGICKSFPGVQALDHVDFDLFSGEVHALVGENGAGKSTLIKILCGVYQPDQGEICLHGQPTVIQGPSHAQSLGISVVHQELNLFPNLSVAENVFVNRLPARGLLSFIDARQAHEATREYLRTFDLDLDPSCAMHRLSVAQQQVVEIAKALSQKARILILDEPTSALTEHESAVLFRIIQRLKEQGLCIVYISHRLEEIFRIADRVTILRDGRRVGSLAVSETNVESVIRMMVGRQLQDLYGQRVASIGQEILRVQGLSSPGRFSDISFLLRRGEILGLAGLIGAGRTELARALFGAERIAVGQVHLDGHLVQIHSPSDAMRLGIAYLSENRHRDELFLQMSVRENTTVSHLKRFSRFGFLIQRLEAQEVQEFVGQLRIHTPSIQQRVMNLSGGNQQKVVLARWLAIQPKVLIADEPTRGIDVGGKAEIYTLLHKLAQQGVGIILISSEMPEILGMSDRILIMHEGKLAGELSREEATEERILTYAAGQATEP